MPTLEGVDNLGTTLDEENDINNRLITVATPLAQTKGAVGFNLAGKIRTITISGSQSGQGYAVAGPTVNEQINAFILQIEEWVNEGTQTTRLYTDGFGNEYTVLCSIFSWTRTAPGNRILYSLSMIEALGLSSFKPD